MGRTQALLTVAWTMALSSRALSTSDDEACHIGSSCKDESDSSSLLQVKSDVQVHMHEAANDGLSRSTQSSNGKQDLVFMHMPFNFGNTIEKVAMFDSSVSRDDLKMYLMWIGGGKFSTVDPEVKPSWEQVKNWTQPGGQVWGHLNPDLQDVSEITGCPLYLTPPKYWPEDVAKKYIGNKTAFAVVRDPYEKLVAQFRGHLPGYGGSATKETLAKCDFNTAIKDMLKTMIATDDPFHGGCVNIPQSEFFEGKYGIQIAVDNWRFPQSANEILQKHGYPWQIRREDILHVNQCRMKWTGDLDAETKALVRQYYKKDFELICKAFGHCDFEENTCLQGVHHMCPFTLFKWDNATEMACPKPGVDPAKYKMRVRAECKR